MLKLGVFLNLKRAINEPIDIDLFIAEFNVLIMDEK